MRQRNITSDFIRNELETVKYGRQYQKWINELQTAIAQKKREEEKLRLNLDKLKGDYRVVRSALDRNYESCQKLLKLSKELAQKNRELTAQIEERQRKISFLEKEDTESKLIVATEKKVYYDCGPVIQLITDVLLDVLMAIAKDSSNLLLVTDPHEMARFLNKNPSALMSYKIDQIAHVADVIYRQRLRYAAYKSLEELYVEKQNQVALS